MFDSGDKMYGLYGIDAPRAPQACQPTVLARQCLQ